jgi:hypothetical protein
MSKKFTLVRNTGLFLITAFFAARGIPLFGAEITVPRFELVTRGAVEEGEFALSSTAAIDIALNGGYKYGALLGLGFESDNLEKALSRGNVKADPLPSGAFVTAENYNALADRMNHQAAFSFRIAQVTARSPFNLPLELSFFIGNSDDFCSGDDFVYRFGTAPIGTGFRGFLYFPKGIGGNISRQYNGIHGVRGTGISVTLTSWDFIVPMVYLYQDFAFADSIQFSERSHYSGDLRFLFNRERVKFEGFMGISAAKAGEPLYRGGFLAFFSSPPSPGIGADFLAQIGIPGWEPGEPFSIDQFYFLVEPRVDFGPLALHITFFYHPTRYLQRKTPEERGKSDINIKLLGGDVFKSGVEGGLETTLGLKVQGEEDFSLLVSPFVSFITTGLRWDVKVRVNPLGYDKPHEMTEFFMGIRAAF